MQTIAPGANILVRDETWRVQRVQRTDDGSLAMHVVGISELVRDRESIFIRELEERIGTVELLEPEKTQLVHDESPGFRDSLLYLESQLRRIPPTDDELHIGHQAAMDVLDFQLEPALKALEQPRQRMLIADSVGLGKTLECGILLSELIKRGRGRRILVVAIKSMLTQFQKELWSRFTIPLVRLDSIGLQRIRQNIPTHQNPFYHFDKTIISVDTLKQNNEYRVHLENAYWDVIVIDEAHNVASRGSSKSQRAELAELLSHRSDSLLMLSATPHDGKPESFASLMNMLDPTAIADPEHYGPEDIQGLFIRRFKKDIEHDVAQNFPTRRIYKVPAEASTAEERAYDELIDLEFSTIDQRRTGYMLFKTTLEKALMSSPAACVETLQNRLKRIERDDPERFEADRAQLSNLLHAVDAIEPQEFSKYQRLLELLEDDDEFRFTGYLRTDRIVIFTERIETMRWLQESLTRDLELDERKVEVLHGGMSDIDQQRIVEEFGQEKADVRLLIASDVASEGINLHYQCHRMIHFDIPWSLMVFRQRNGRIDRYGQTEVPRIAYLYTQSQNDDVRGDTRILELLIDKDEQATQNIGDPGAFMGVYDIDAETAIVAEAIEDNIEADEFEKQLKNNDFNPLEFMVQKASRMGATQVAASARTHESPGLFDDHYDYVSKALESIGGIEVELEPDRRLLRIHMPEDLGDRFELLPDEVEPADGVVVLSEDTALIQQEIVTARSEESAWPAVHYLWPLNPVVGWINDRMSANFGRHAAPVLRVHEGLEANECVFVVSGLIPNQKSHPMVHRWFSVVFDGEDLARVEDFQHTLKRTELQNGKLVNDGKEPDLEALRTRLPRAVEEARQRMHVEHDDFREALNAKLDAELDKLAELEERQMAYITETYENKKGARHQLEREKKERKVRRVFEEYSDWVNETLSTEEHPFIQIIAVLTR